MPTVVFLVSLAAWAFWSPAGQAAEDTPIHGIQGEGPRSPLDGQVVTITGVVTLRRRNGFHIQSRVDEEDADPRTSEGLFVFTSSVPPADAAPGNLVRVIGTVTEFVPAADPASPSLTELTRPEISVLSRGQALPPPVVLSGEHVTGNGDLEQLESFEGMRVQFGPVRVVGPTSGTLTETTGAARSNGVFYAVLEGMPRPLREPGVPAPDPLPVGAPRFDNNPERLRIDTAAADGSTPVDVACGAVIRRLAGALDYGFRAWTLVSDPALPAEIAGNRGTAASLIPPSRQELPVATFNLRRLYDDRDDPGADAVLTAEAYDHRLSKMARAIREVLLVPDVLAVQEAENLAVLEALAARLGPGYRAFLQEGNDPSGIDVGFLVNTARVTVQEVLQIAKDATYTTPDGRQAILHDRPPLVLRTRAGDFPFVVINNHLRSMIDVEQPGVQAKRRAQAEAVAALARSLAGENLIVLGDFNAFEFTDGYVDMFDLIRSGSQPPLVDAVASSGLPPQQAYSYIQDGSAQRLDHILMNENTAARLSRLQVARLNADFPVILAGDSARPERASDHEPLVLYLRLDAATPRLQVSGVRSAAGFAGNIAPGEALSLHGVNLGPLLPVAAAPPALGQSYPRILGGTRVLFDGEAAPLLFAGSGQVNAVAPFALAGRERTRLRIESLGQPAAELDAPVVPAAPGLLWIDAGVGPQPAILNQNYSLNGLANPAPRGSVVMIYTTGAGPMQPPGQDGILTAPPLPRPLLPVSATIDGVLADILFAGAAPSLVAGVVQVNAVVPAAARSGQVPVVLTVDGVSSPPGATMAVR